MSLIPSSSSSSSSHFPHSSVYHEFSSAEISGIRLSLLAWYSANRRKLPWRGDEVELDENGNQIDEFKPEIQDQKPAQKKTFKAFFKPADDEGKTANETENTGTGNENRQFPPSTSSASSPTKKNSVKFHLPISPYSVWVSELMCQQTRVDTAIGYFVRWMRKFPSIEILAAQQWESVNGMWQGLGYYRRAKYLLEGAKLIVSDPKYNNSLPDTVAELLKIPGIGPYTAGAIASIAFNRSTPLVDGNVIRVFSRLRAIYRDSKSAAVTSLFWRLGTSLVVDSQSPGDFNQSLMELGALICTPKNPKCSICPIRLHCHAAAEIDNQRRPWKTEFQTIGKSAKKIPDLEEIHLDEPGKTMKSADCERVDCLICDSEFEFPSSITDYPAKVDKKPPVEQNLAVAIVSKRRGDGQAEFILIKRAESGLLAGQFEFPTVFVDSDSTESDRRNSIDEFLKNEIGAFAVASRHSIDSLVHIFSHRKHIMAVERIQLSKCGDSIKNRTRDCVWLTESEIESMGITTGMKKVFAIRNEKSTKMKNAKATSPKKKIKRIISSSESDESESEIIHSSPPAKKLKIETINKIVKKSTTNVKAKAKVEIEVIEID